MVHWRRSHFPKKRKKEKNPADFYAQRARSVLSLTKEEKER